MDSRWINQLDELCLDFSLAKIRKRIVLDDDEMITGSVILGYRKEGFDIPAKKRKDDFIRFI